MDGQLKVSTGEPLVETTVVRRKIKMYLLQKLEIDRLVEGYSSPSLSLFTLFCGAFVSLLITVFTAGLKDLTKLYFVISTILMGCLSLAFALSAKQDWQKAQSIVKDWEGQQGVDVDVAVQARPSTEQKRMP
jgi:hypothetical protein